MAAKTKTGLEENVAAALSYVLGWLTGIIFFVIEDNKFVKFHAAQSIITFGLLFLASWILVPLSVFVSFVFFPITYLLSTGIWILTIVLWILLIIKAAQHEKFKLPVIGEWAEKLAK